MQNNYTKANFPARGAALRERLVPGCDAVLPCDGLLSAEDRQAQPACPLPPCRGRLPDRKVCRRRQGVHRPLQQFRARRTGAGCHIAVQHRLLLLQAGTVCGCCQVVRHLPGHRQSALPRRRPDPPCGLRLRLEGLQVCRGFVSGRAERILFSGQDISLLPAGALLRPFRRQEAQGQRPEPCGGGFRGCPDV